jgi:iron complex outermembrane receptor protein
MRSTISIICFAANASLGAQTRPDSLRRDSLPKALPTLQVTATAVATDARRVAQPTAVMAGAQLRRAQGASLGETLEQIPGVRSLSMTTGIGKPVIRGLTNNRVVTLANGQRTETQQWGHDHSPNVESADAERLEVVKGPASVLYGSDALGGVVNVVRRALPTTDGAMLTRGRVSLAYNSANTAPSATLGVAAHRHLAPRQRPAHA